MVITEYLLHPLLLQNIHLTYSKLLYWAAKTAQQLETLFFEDLSLVPSTHVRWLLTTTYHSSSRGAKALFCHPQVPALVHTNNKHKSKNPYSSSTTVANSAFHQTMNSELLFLLEITYYHMNTFRNSQCNRNLNYLFYF